MCSLEIWDCDEFIYYSITYQHWDVQCLAVSDIKSASSSGGLHLINGADSGCLLSSAAEVFIIIMYYYHYYY